MAIVGGGAALIAIAAYLAIFAIKSLRVSRRMRQAERPIAHCHDAQDAPRRAEAQVSTNASP